MNGDVFMEKKSPYSELGQKMWECCGKRVELIEADGNVIQGKGFGFEDDWDNEEGEYSILFLSDNGDHWLMFESEIKSIKILDE